MRKIFAAILLSITMAVTPVLSVGCASTSEGNITDWGPMIRALDQAVSDYVMVKFPEPTPEQALIMSVKAIALEAIIIAMQKNGAPEAVIADARAKADAAYGDKKIGNEARGNVSEFDVRKAEQSFGG